MKASFLIKSIFFIAILNCPLLLIAQNTSPADTFPVPPESQNEIFYLQRQPNTNTIVCELNVKNNKLDADNPVHVFWIRYAEKGQKEELSWIQRTFAYGIHSKKISDSEYELNFVSYKNKKFWLEKDNAGIWRVYANLTNGKKMILKRIYIHIDGGSFWSPNIEYVELKGLEPGTNQEIRERIKIK
jgi:hypothetical protein